MKLLMENRVEILTRPHPGPLPQERENHSPRWLQTDACRCSSATGGISKSNKREEARWNVQAYPVALPLLGERAGVRADNLQHLQLRRSAIVVETDCPANPTSPGGATCTRRCRSYGAWSLGFGVLLQRCRPSGADTTDSLNRKMLKPRPASRSAEHCSAKNAFRTDQP